VADPGIGNKGNEVIALFSFSLLSIFCNYAPICFLSTPIAQIGSIDLGCINAQ